MSEIISYTSSGDGFIYQLGATFLAAHDAATGTVDETSNYDYVGIYSLNPNQWIVYRTFLFIDTFLLPTDAIIIKAVLSIYMNNIYRYVSVGYDFDIVVQNGQPTYPHDPLVVGDYLYSHYSGDGGSINTADVTSEKYYDIELSAIARNWIKGGEITKLCLRSQVDIDGTGIPTNKQAYIYIYAVEAGAEYRAKLTITYADFAAVERTITATATASAGDIALVGGKKTLTINNHLIQTVAIAQTIADAYLAEYKNQKTIIRIVSITPLPYEIGDTILYENYQPFGKGVIPYKPAAEAVIPYKPAAEAEHYYYNPAVRYLMIRKINLSFSAGSFINMLELE